MSQFTLSLALLAVGTTAQASPLQEDVRNNLTTMKAVYAAAYAPADWKKKFAGYELNAEYAKAIAAVDANPALSLLDARGIIKEFIYSMKDYHTSIGFYSTELATLPFLVRGAENRLFFVYIDRAKLPESTFPFNIGDELISFEGRPANEVVAEVQAETPANVTATDRALAELTLTRRRASRGYRVPQGPVSIGVRPKGATDVVSHQLIWDTLRNKWALEHHLPAS